MTALLVLVAFGVEDFSSSNLITVSSVKVKVYSIVGDEAVAVAILVSLINNLYAVTFTAKGDSQARYKTTSEPLLYEPINVSEDGTSPSLTIISLFMVILLR